MTKRHRSRQMDSPLFLLMFVCPVFCCSMCCLPLVAALSLASMQIWLVGISQSLFEGSMYTFVFMWTPQLEETNITGDKLPYGTVFAIFMVSCMIGSTCCNMLGRQATHRARLADSWAVLQVEACPRIHGLCIWPRWSGAGACRLGDGLRHSGGTLSPSMLPHVPHLQHCLQLLGFCVFEGCCGVYFPTWGSLRSAAVPEVPAHAVIAMSPSHIAMSPSHIG